MNGLSEGDVLELVFGPVDLGLGMVINHYDFKLKTFNRIRVMIR